MIIKSIRELLVGRSLFWVAPEDTLEEACDLMVSENVGAVVVLDRGVLKGILSERDVIRHVSQRGGLNATPVAEIMTLEVDWIDARASLVEAMSKMHAGGFRHLPVMDRSRKVVGMVSMRDIPAQYMVMQDRFSRWRSEAA